MLDTLAQWISPRLMRTIHLYSATLMLAAMLFFSVTGVTLNHPDWLSQTQTTLTEAQLPKALMQTLDAARSVQGFPSSVLDWLQREQRVDGQQVSVDWNVAEELLLIDIQQPGGYTLTEIDLVSGHVVIEQRQGSWVQVLNDLHKGRYVGELWKVFIDVSALIMVVFTLSGFWLILPQKRRRQSLLGVALAGTVALFVLYRGSI